MLEACKIINDELARQDCRYCVDLNVPHCDAIHLSRTRIGYCRKNSDLIQYVMRSCNIPVATNFMPYTPDYRYSHEWKVASDTIEEYIQYCNDRIGPLRNIIPK